MGQAVSTEGAADGERRMVPDDDRDERALSDLSRYLPATTWGVGAPHAGLTEEVDGDDHRNSVPTRAHAPVQGLVEASESLNGGRAVPLVAGMSVRGDRVAPTGPTSEDGFFLSGDTGEAAGPITLPEDLGKQAAMAVHHLGDSFVRAAETGHKDVNERVIDERVKQQMQPLHHKRRAATRRLYTPGFRETQGQAEHIR